MNTCNRKEDSQKTVSLLEMLKREAIKVDVEAKDWKEAVRKVGEILISIDAIEPQYIDAMIKTVQEMGPYIVMTKGIALPHARPEEGAKKPALAIAKLKKPIEFGNPDNDPVSVLIAFATPDSKSHVKALSQLAKVLMEPINIEKLMSARSPDEIYEVFSRALNDLG